MRSLHSLFARSHTEVPMIDRGEGNGVPEEATLVPPQMNASTLPHMGHDLQVDPPALHSVRKDPVCQVCRDLDIRFVKAHDPSKVEVEKTKTFPFFKMQGIRSLQFSFRDLKASSTAGCVTCSLVFRAISGHISQEDQRDNHNVLLYRETQLFARGSVLGPLSILVSSDELREQPILDPNGEPWKPVGGKPRTVRKGGPILELELYDTVDAPSPWFAIGPARNIAEDKLSPETVALVLSWFDECNHLAGIGWHQSCPKIEDTPLPTRVLCVGSELEEPRLLHTAGKTGKYIALSYCWGQSLPLTTTFATVDSFEQSISMDLLPKTLQDAVRVARAYKVEYLWIDALCIIQDCPEDWAQESSKMGQIYEQAYFVVSADAALDCNDGFLSKHSQNLYRFSVELKYLIPSGESGVLFARPKGKTPHYKLGDSVQYHPAFAHTRDGRYHGRLFSRGWVFQERVLARRTLCFSAGEMAWECKTIRRCECMLTVSENGSAGDLGSHLSSNMSSYAASKISELTSAYTQLELTKEEDRLHAYSGLAAFISNRCQLTYLAGLWKECLPLQLLWCIKREVYQGQVNSKRITPHQAPSWSWASISGPTTYHRMTNYSNPVDSFRIVEVDCAPQGRNPYGPVQGARLWVAGPSLSVELDPSLDLNSSSDMALTVVAKLGRFHRMKEFKFQAEFTPDVLGENLEVVGGEELTILALTCSRRKAFCAVYGLVLRPCGEGEILYWTRVGHFISSEEKWTRSSSLNLFTKAPVQYFMIV